MTPPKNCPGLFQGTYDGLPWFRFCEQASIWPKQMQINHGIKVFSGNKQFFEVRTTKFSKVVGMAWMQGFGCNIKFDTMVLGILSTKGQDKLDCGGCGIVG